LTEKFWALLCVTAVAIPVFAQTTADEGLLHRRELVRRFMTASHLDEQMKKLTDTLLPMVMADTENQYPDIPDTVKSALKSSATEAFSTFLPKLENRYADLMAKKFTVEELEQVDEFYESPIGQKVVSKSAEMITEIQPLVADLLPDLQADMLRRFCAKVDCSTLPKPSPT
jgi:hypothetical protein